MRLNRAQLRKVLLEEVRVLNESDQLESEIKGLILKIEDDAVAEALDKMLKLLAPKNSDTSRPTSGGSPKRSSKPQAKDMRE